MICQICGAETQNKPDEAFYCLIKLCDDCKDVIGYEDKVKELNDSLASTFVEYLSSCNIQIEDYEENPEYDIVCQKCSAIVPRSASRAGVFFVNGTLKYYGICSDCNETVLINDKMKALRKAASSELSNFLTGDK